MSGLQLAPSDRPRPPARWRRHALVATLLCLLLAAVGPSAPAWAQSNDDKTAKGAPAADDPAPPGAPAPGKAAPTVRPIVFPVIGPVRYTDTFGACRDGCTRTHKGVDIFGDKLSPLVAAADGTVVAIRRSALTRAGNEITIRDDEGWYYLYLHLNNDSPGTDDGANPQSWIVASRLKVGMRVRAGDLLGYLGDSGNAESLPAHLHFEIHQPGVGVINPTPSVRAAQAAGRVRPVKDVATTAAQRKAHANEVTSWYRLLLKRNPTPRELTAWTSRMALGLGDRDDLVADLTMAPSRRDPAGQVLRSYDVVLGRRPEAAAVKFWEAKARAGLTSEPMAGVLIESKEFASQGALSDAQFIDRIYRNARGQAPAPAVTQYWLDQLAGGRSRASMAASFIDSAGVIDATWHELEVLQAYRATLNRLPTDAEWNQWRDRMNGGLLLAEVVGAIRR